MMRILLLLIKFKVGVDGEEASEPRECSFDKVVVALIPDHQEEKEEECDENDDNWPTFQVMVNFTRGIFTGANQKKKNGFSQPELLLHAILYLREDSLNYFLFRSELFCARKMVVALWWRPHFDVLPILFGWLADDISCVSFSRSDDIS